MRERNLKTWDEIMQNIEDIESDNIKSALKLLSEYNGELKMYLANITASLCDIDVSCLFGDTHKIDYNKARWLYWYALRYMTGESFESIGLRNPQRQFSDTCVSQSVTKMSMMIADDEIWAKRWSILRRIIKMMVKVEEHEKELFPRKIKVKVTVPKGVEVEFLKD